MPTTIGYPDKLQRVSKAKTEAVQRAKERIEQGLSFRATQRHESWRRSERQYKGKHWGYGNPDDPTADLITVNMSFSTVNTIVPYITGNEPEFIVEPYAGSATVTRARIQQAFLNRLWRSQRFDGQAALEEAAVDGLIYGDGYLKIGYDIIERRRQGGEDTFEIAELWISRITPWDLVIDPSADGLHNARWVAQRVRLTRAELTADKRYRHTDDHNVQYGSTLLHADDNAEERDAEVRFVEESFDGGEWASLWEYYDLVNNRMMVISQGERPLRWVEDIGAIPIVQFGNYRIPGSPYHMGELEQIWDLQQELNKTRSQMITHRRRNAAKLLARKDSLDQDALAALQSSVVFDVAFVAGDQPISDIVVPVSTPNLTADAYNINDVILRDIYEISGVNEYLRGATPTIRRTATEATIIEGASNVKSQHKLRMVERAARHVGSLILRMASDVFPLTDFNEVQLFITGREAEAINRATLGEVLIAAQQEGVPPEELAQLSDPSLLTDDLILRPTPDIFQGEYEVLVQQASTELRNPVLREQKYREIVITTVEMLPALMQTGVFPNIKRMLELWWEAAGIDDIESLFDGGQGSMAAMMQGQLGPGTLPGQPNPGNARPPTQLPSAENSGLLGAESPAYQV